MEQDKGIKKEAIVSLEKVLDDSFTEDWSPFKGEIMDPREVRRWRLFAEGEEGKRKTDALMEQYKGKGFDSQQLKEIRIGHEDNTDVSIYADPKFSCEKMKMLRLIVERGRDISKIADPRFTWEQLGTLGSALDEDLDISSLLNPEIPWRDMYDLVEEMLEEKAKMIINNASKE